MCDPMTLAMLGMGAVSIVTSLFGGGEDAVPPPAEAPAIAAPTYRKGGADVRLGRKNKAATAEAGTATGRFKEKRTSAVALGGLGRSGMQL